MPSYGPPLVVLQVFFAGLGIFGAASYDTHKAFGNVLPGLDGDPSAAGDRRAAHRARHRDGRGAVILVTIQIGLVSARDDAPGLAALHPVLALFAMGLAVHMGLHVLRPRRPVAAAG